MKTLKSLRNTESSTGLGYSNLVMEIMHIRDWQTLIAAILSGND